MDARDFHGYAVEYIQFIEQQTGVRFDERFNGRRILDAFHLEVSPSVAAILHTEIALGSRAETGTRVHFDLKELANVVPPFGEENVFVTFTAGSAGYPGEDGMAFGLHFAGLDNTELGNTAALFADQPPGADRCRELESHIFQHGENLAYCYSVMVYTLSTSGEMSVATTRISIGLNPEGRLVAYALSGLGDASGPVAGIPPSSEWLMLLLFLSLSTFLSVNQGEAQLTLVGERKGIIG